MRQDMFEANCIRSARVFSKRRGLSIPASVNVFSPGPTRSRCSKDMKLLISLENIGAMNFPGSSSFTFLDTVIDALLAACILACW